jgi:phosphohistidine phosphatase
MEAAKLDEQQITWNEDLYFGSVRDYIGAIQSASDEYERIMLVGHNPLMESTAGVLSGGQDKTAVRMPTAAIVCLESFADSWQTIAPGTCQIKWMMIPKVLKRF